MQQQIWGSTNKHENGDYDADRILQTRFVTRDGIWVKDNNISQLPPDKMCKICNVGYVKSDNRL